MMNNVALACYYLSRLHYHISRRFWQWTLSTYLTRKSNSCVSVRVNGFGRFDGVSGLTIGRNVHVNFGANWVCDGGLYIGDNVHISSNCTIYTRNHNARGTALPYDEQNIKRPVHIGRNVWIGTNVTIVPGANIGEGAIIGAGAIVHGKIAPLTILGAGPTTDIGTRDQDHYNRLDSAGHYGGVNGQRISWQQTR
ncbi:acyltransferase [Sulfitobacter sp. M13]